MKGTDGQKNLAEKLGVKDFSESEKAQALPEEFAMAQYEAWREARKQPLHCACLACLRNPDWDKKMQYPLCTTQGCIRFGVGECKDPVECANE